LQKKNQILRIRQINIEVLQPIFHHTESAYFATIEKGRGPDDQ